MAFNHAIVIIRGYFRVTSFLRQTSEYIFNEPLNHEWEILVGRLGRKPTFAKDPLEEFSVEICIHLRISIDSNLFNVLEIKFYHGRFMGVRKDLDWTLKILRLQVVVFKTRRRLYIAALFFTSHLTALGHISLLRKFESFR